MRFSKGKIPATSGIQLMFHQIRFRKSDQDALRFVWRECQLKPIEDYVMCVRLFGKLESPCIYLKESSNKAKYNDDITDAVHKNFCMDEYLGPRRNTDFAKETVVNATKLLLEEFRLKKWI